MVSLKSSKMDFNYAVIGSGIEGSATAYYLAKNGFKTILLDQFRKGHTRGSSTGNSRITRKAYDEPEYVHMMQRAYELWSQLERDFGEELFRKTGLLVLGAVDGKIVDKVAASLSAHNAPFTLLNNQEIQSRYPQIKYGSKWRGLFDPEAGLLKADQCLRALQDQFIKHGGVFHDGNCVINMTMFDNRVEIQTSSGLQYLCDGVAVCVGPWAGSFLYKHFGLNLPLKIRAVKSCYWKVHDSGTYSSESFPCILSTEEPAADQQEDHMYEFFGIPSDEYNDLFKFCCNTGTDIDDPDKRDSCSQNPLSIKKPSQYITDHFHGLDTKPAIVENCMFTLTPDEHFILDRHPKYQNIVIGAGFSGHGFKFGPVIGEILGSMLLKRHLPFDLKMFQMDRFMAHANSRL